MFYYVPAPFQLPLWYVPTQLTVVSARSFEVLLDIAGPWVGQMLGGRGGVIGNDQNNELKSESEMSEVRN